MEGNAEITPDSGRSQKVRVTFAVLAMLPIVTGAAFLEDNIVGMLASVAGGFVYSVTGKPVTKRRAMFESARFMAIFMGVLLLMAWAAFGMFLAVMGELSGFIESMTSRWVGIMFFVAVIVISLLMIAVEAALAAIGGLLSALVRKSPPEPMPQSYGTATEPDRKYYESVDPWA